MKERLVTLALAACALALFWILLVPKPQGAPAAPHPVTTGVDGEGYFAAARWLVATGVPTLELHQRFAQLADKTISPHPTGNLLITTLPYGVVLNPEEYSDLDTWIGRGNTMLVLAALDDTPLWSALSTNFLPELQKRCVAIDFTAVQVAGTDPITKAKAGLVFALTSGGGTVELHPSGRIGLLDGIRQLATLSALPSQQWQAKAIDAAPVLELARRADSADAVLWVKSSGNGAIIVSAYASLFSNQVIGKADNSRLLSNIVAWSLQPGGRVIFDDAHQGAMDEYDAAKFMADPRLHRTLLWLLVLWLAWVVASQPLRASAPRVATLDENAMLRVTANFFAGVLRPVTSAQWLLDEFFDRLRRRHGLANSGGPPWDWLASHAGVPRGQLEELRDLYARTQSGQRVSLIRLQQRFFRRFQGIPHDKCICRIWSPVFNSASAKWCWGSTPPCARCASRWWRAAMCWCKACPVWARLCSTAKSLAGALGGSFKRVQGTSDLMPTDITGTHLFDGAKNAFVFRPGPLFADVLLFDEVNRAGPRTQSALLEAMEERQVSVDREMFALPADFLVIATQNPREFEGTYPLPESQLDRFMLRLDLSYPALEAETEVLLRYTGVAAEPARAVGQAGAARSGCSRRERLRRPGFHFAAALRLRARRRPRVTRARATVPGTIDAWCFGADAGGAHPGRHRGRGICDR